MSDSKSKKNEYEDLVNELRDLQQFIDDIDSPASATSSITNSDDVDPAITSVPTNELLEEHESAEESLTDNEQSALVVEPSIPDVQNKQKPPADNDVDDLPLLNVVISRKEAMKDIQLDLLSTVETSHPIEPSENVASDTDSSTNHQVAGNSTQSNASTEASDIDDDIGNLHSTVESEPPTLQPGSIGQVETENSKITTEVIEERSSEEITRFVYDLSERILDVFEDKLTERNGEILPLDLRDELKHEVADILYEWCDQSE